MSRNYLVTGGAGFIGSNFVHRLLQRGENVTIYDNLSRAGAPKNLAWLEQEFGKDSFRLIAGDIRARTVWKKTGLAGSGSKYFLSRTMKLSRVRVSVSEV